MIRIAMFMGAVLLAGSVTACIPAATDAELDAMCKNLVQVRGEVAVESIEDLKQGIEKRFAELGENIERARAAEIKLWDEELAAKLKEAEEQDEDAEDPLDPKKIKTEFAAKKAESNKPFDEQKSQIEPDKQAAIKDAEARVSKATADLAAAVEKCVGEAKAEGVGQQIAQCRVKAESTDAYWNKCR